MRLTDDDVRHIADLARLELADDECAEMRDRLSSVLEFVAKLGEVGTEDVEPMNHSVEMHDSMRDDAVCAAADGVRDRIVEGFPEKEGDLLKVKAVF